MVEPIPIVKFLRSVDAHAEKKLVVGEKLAPLVIEQNCICLQEVTYLPAAAVFFLQFHRPFIEIQPHQHRLAPLPGKARCWKTQLHIIFRHSLQYFIAHPLSAPPDLRCPALVKTVPAIHIAIRTGRLD